MNDKERFKLAMQYLFKAEGAYSNHKCDKGGATNYGITQKTYDYYRKKKELCLQPVINITKQEAENIYYEDFWLLSGANKENDFAMALVLFDSCVNHGLSIGKKLYKQSNGDVNKFLELRRTKYKAIVQNNPSQKVFLKGWLNRINNLEKFINERQKND